MTKKDRKLYRKAYIFTLTALLGAHPVAAKQIENTATKQVLQSHQQ